MRCRRCGRDNFWTEHRYILVYPGRRTLKCTCGRRQTYAYRQFFNRYELVDDSMGPIEDDGYLEDFCEADEDGIEIVKEEIRCPECKANANMDEDLVTEEDEPEYFAGSDRWIAMCGTCGYQG